MSYIYSIVMFAMTAGLLLYAGCLALFKDEKMIRRMYTVKVTDPKRYVVQFAKMMALFSLPFLVSGILGLFWFFPALIALVAGFIGVCVAAVKLMDDGSDE